jgi:PKD repeat protein
MSTVGSSSRVGWFMEPNCQGCHTGTATSNNGQIRYTSVFTDTNYSNVRVPVNQTFATPANTPAPGISLYRFSAGHGGLQCSACHGSTHAEFPATHANDNARNIQIQGHAGVMAECTACHVSMSVSSTTAAGGPHGMHPIGAAWAKDHHDFIGDLNNCRACHGTDLRGTVLSKSQGDKVLVASFDGGVRVTNVLFRGAIVGCYNCHNGSGSDSPNTSPAPMVSVVSGSTFNTAPLNLPVSVTPANATLRIISQPAGGSIGVSNNVLTYFPAEGFSGVEKFTYAAWDGAHNSLLATGTVTVTQGTYLLGVVAHVPTNSPLGWPVAFAAVPSATNYSGPVSFSWHFGDGSPASTNQFPSHTYAARGTYFWSVTATASNATASATGAITITEPAQVAMSPAGGASLNLVLPPVSGGLVLEQSDSLAANAIWTPVTNRPTGGPGGNNFQIPVSNGNRFFRVRQVW